MSWAIGSWYAYTSAHATCLDPTTAQVVAADERETNDIRATLNLGHTFGHAIENFAGYGVWLHGEAVAAGTIMAADLSHRMGWIEEGLCKRIVAIMEKSKLPTKVSSFAPLRPLAHNFIVSILHARI